MLHVGRPRIPMGLYHGVSYVLYPRYVALCSYMLPWYIYDVLRSMYVYALYHDIPEQWYSKYMMQGVREEEHAARNHHQARNTDAKNATRRQRGRED